MKNARKATAVLAAAAAVMFACAALCQEPAKPAPRTIITDGSWKTGTAEEKGWNTEDFNDGSWKAAECPCVDNPGYYDTLVPENCLGHPNAAQWIWAPGNGMACFLRKTLKVESELKCAEMVLLADDNVKLFVNGVFLQEWDTRASEAWTYKGCAAIVDILPFLRNGDNIIACQVVNTGGPCGFMAEIRLDCAPSFAIPGEAAGPKIAEEDLRALRALVEKLGSDSWDERESATAELLKLARELGEPARAFLTGLADSEDSEIAWRAQTILDELAPKGKGGAFEFAALGLEDLRKLLTSRAERMCNLYRHVHAVRELLGTGRKQVCGMLADMLDSDRIEVQTRVVQFADILEIPELLPALCKYAENAKDGVGRVWAVSAVAKLGTPAELALLEKLAESHSGEEDEVSAAILRTALRGIERIKAK